jgi:predicted dehydrogenase
MVFFGCAAGTKPVRVARKLSANDKLNIACIGGGGKGFVDMKGVSRNNNIVAICDVDWERAANGFKVFPGAKKYKDFREMLDKEGKGIDAVTISTPDNVHAVAAMACMQLGKHVYVQKPLTHDIYEARLLTETARKYKVATQMGNQGHAYESLRRLTYWLDSGLIGAVREVHCWTNRPTWPQGGLTRPTEKVEVPATLDWNLWLGPAPERPYHPKYAPHVWRGWWDFGCGALGDMACHVMDPAYGSLKLGVPTSVEAQSEGNTAEGGPSWSIIAFQFPARGTMPPVKLTWWDGGKMPPRPEGIPADAKMGDDECGTLFVGEKGFLTCDTYSGSPRLVPYAKVELPKKEFIVSNTYAEWVGACKGGDPAGANFDYAGPFTETILLGNLAIRSGKKIEWNTKELKVTNAPEANQYVKRTYRKGWEI